MYGVALLIVIVILFAYFVFWRENLLGTSRFIRLGSYDPNMYGGLTTPPQLRDQSSFYTA